VEMKQDRDPEPRRRHRHGDSDEFWKNIGVDVERMSPRAQVTTSLALLIPVAVAGVAVLTLFPSFWWLIFVFGWTIFPAFGLLVRGVARISEGEGRPEISAGNSQERELLGALRTHGELTPAQAAMETSLSVAEADRMLKELAEGGHLDVRVRGGGLFYALWQREQNEEPRELGVGP
jgi:hypothetical protein